MAGNNTVTSLRISMRVSVGLRSNVNILDLSRRLETKNAGKPIFDT